MRTWWSIAAVALIAVSGCGGQEAGRGEPSAQRDRVLASWPHDSGAFTQGLLFQDGRLYESTGLQGESSVREVEPVTGRVLRRHDLATQHFGEGLTYLDGKLYQLTWRSQLAFVYDARTFEQVSSFDYRGEGWGLATDGQQLILSDGSSRLRFLDPADGRELRELPVTDAGRPVEQLNELEWVRGELYANVWKSPRIARIDPTNGRVIGWLDLTQLAVEQQTGPENVLNGIAYDPARDRLLVTGKRWSRVYELQRP